MKALLVEALAVDALASLALLRDAPFQSGAGWWRAVVATALPDGTGARFLLVRQDGVPVLLFPLRCRAGRSDALVTPYTCLFQPVADPRCDFERAGAAIGPWLGRVCRIDGIDPGWPGWTGLRRGLARAGRPSQAFDSFVNRHETIAAGGWSGYLASRPGALRSTIRRRLAAAEARLSFALHRDAGGPGQGMDDYLDVARRSWKPAEPFPGFLRAFAVEADRAGCLRVTTLREANKVVAAQVWTVENRRATVHKLAHDRSLEAGSPGTVLTAWTIRRLIEDEGVTEIDFGRGDDPYKGSWATGRRVRGGLLITDRTSLAGLSAAARHAGGRLARRIEHRLRPASASDGRG